MEPPALVLHPWSVFLRARKDAIDWLAAAGEPDDRIAAALVLTPVQVTYLRLNDAVHTEWPVPPEELQ